MLHLNGDSDTEKVRSAKVRYLYKYISNVRQNLWKKDMLTSLSGHSSLDARYLQEMYMDCKSSNMRSRSLSPMSSDSSISHTFSPGFASSTPIPTNMPQLGMQPSNYANFLPNTKDIGIYKTPLLTQTSSVHSRQRHQQNIYSENTIHQPHLSHIEAQKQQKNEISKSLKMFAMLAAYKNGNDYIRQREPPVDDIMQDFYCNGYVTDDSNIYQPEDSLMEGPLHKHYIPNYNDHRKNVSYNDMNFNNYGVSRQNDSNCVNDNANIAALNSHYLNKNMWMFHLPTHSPYFGNGFTSLGHNQNEATVAAAAAATAAAAANIDYNNQIIKKQQKRYGSAKFDKYATVKHCVFCENNNEPEAVVKSHAVRDSLGRVLCPKLRTYICPICKASGDKAHTVKYCPQKPIITMEDAVKAESLRLAKNSYFKQGMKV